MNSPHFFHRLLRSQRKGWILIEVILCLALLAVILFAIQGQSDAQWKSVQLAQSQLRQYENQQKKEAMEHLLGRSLQDQESRGTYPECQKCSGSDLVEWFYASLNSAPESIVHPLKKGGE